MDVAARRGDVDVEDDMPKGCIVPELPRRGFKLWIKPAPAILILPPFL